MASSERWSLFLRMVAFREFSEAEEMLAETPELLEERNGLGETVLHYLAVENDQEGVAWLHSKGADLNTQNEFGTPPLYEATLLGYKGLARWMVEHGARFDLKNDDGEDFRAFAEEHEILNRYEYLKSFQENQ